MAIEGSSKSDSISFIGLWVVSEEEIEEVDILIKVKMYNLRMNK